MDFNKSKTKENLARIFAAECQDGARYQFMAKAAVSEGFSYISDQLKMLAKNEMAHASMIYSLILENLGKGNDNVPIEAGYPFEPSLLKTSLATSADIELFEGKNIYPSFAKVARDEGFGEIAKKILLIAAVEETHHQKLNALAKLYKANKLYKNPEKIMWECSNCGNRACAKEAWKECPLCGYPQGYVIVPPEKLQALYN